MEECDMIKHVANESAENVETTSCPCLQTTTTYQEVSTTAAATRSFRDMGTGNAATCENSEI